MARHGIYEATLPSCSQAHLSCGVTRREVLTRQASEKKRVRPHRRKRYTSSDACYNRAATLSFFVSPIVGALFVTCSPSLSILTPHSSLLTLLSSFYYSSSVFTVPSTLDTAVHCSQVFFLLVESARSNIQHISASCILHAPSVSLVAASASLCDHRVTYARRGVLEFGEYDMLDRRDNNP